jgi:hypothetical protein
VKRRAHPDGTTYRLVLNPAHGPALLKLAADSGAELMWATFWEGHANTWVAPHVGLPTLPVVPIPFRPRWGPDSVATAGTWKLKNVLARLGDRPFIWFDDDANPVNRPGQYVVHVDETTGLTDDHLRIARETLAFRVDDGLRCDRFVDRGPR